MRFLLLVLGVLVLLGLAPRANAQAPLDWTDGGAIQMPSQDLDGDTFPAGTAMTCDVAVAGVTLRVSSTAGSTVSVGAVPKGSSGTATADCESALLPGVRGTAASAQVLLRPWLAPRAPTLRP